MKILSVTTMFFIKIGASYTNLAPIWRVLANAVAAGDFGCAEGAIS